MKDTAHTTPEQSRVRGIWDGRYVRQETFEPDVWLKRWEDLPQDAEGSSVLDVGCGSGSDSRFLSDLGLNVVSLDFSIEAFRRATESGLAPGRLVQGDITEGIPFRSRSFDLIVANLVLHYFRWDNTLKVMGELARCLKPAGKLLVRVNSTDDVEFGATGNPEIEPGLYLVEGVAKRFFDRESLGRLFDDRWNVLDVCERTSERGSRTKRLWEVLAERCISEG